MEKKNLVVLSGAGISVEAGLPLYRGDEGIWNNATMLQLANPAAWEKDPKTVLEFYNWRRAMLAGVEPTAAHILLAKMEREFDVHILTQNVDDLHERAGSSDIVHLHGELTCVRPDGTYTYEDGFCEDEVIRVGYRAINLGETGGMSNRQLRPHVVFFGEPVPKMLVARQTVAKADILLVVGTSLKVQPAAGLLKYASPDCDFYVIDPDKLELISSRIPVHIQAKASEGMPVFAKYIGFTGI